MFEIRKREIPTDPASASQLHDYLRGAINRAAGIANLLESADDDTPSDSVAHSAEALYLELSEMQEAIDAYEKATAKMRQLEVAK